MEWKINGKTGRGQARKTNLGNMKELLLSIIYIANFNEIIRLADKRGDWLQRQGEAFRQ